MTNEQIIADVAITSGIYTAEEVEEMVESGREIPLHTIKGWDARGRKIKVGEHGIETKLWKKKSKKDGQENDSEVTDKDFYLAKAFLFTKDQVEIKEIAKCAE